MKTIKILALCVITTFGYAQNKLNKVSQSIKVNKNVIINLNTSYVEIEIDTWNRDIVEIEAYIESTKLSKDELKRALDTWGLEVEGSNDEVTISSTGGRKIGLFEEGDYAMLLNDLEFELADLPEVPRMPRIPRMPQIPAMPDMPAMPEMPELPELPKNVKTMSFDYDRYEEEGEKYLIEWSKEYKKKGGKELKKSMEEWSKKLAESGYQEKMEKWGEEYGKLFEGKWAKEMEKWGEDFGEKFGKDWEVKMEAWGKRVEKEMEERNKIRSESMEKRMEEREKHMKDRREDMHDRREAVLARRLESGTSSKVKKVIKIKIPKKAKLKTNIRHGELKLSSVIYNMSGDISHSLLVAEHIDGGDTSINVSYSPVDINIWNVGTLNLNFVDRAQIKNANNLVLNAKSSNINIINLTDIGIIDGSFGDLTISNLTSSFKNLNLVLENSDALVHLPKNIDYSLYFKGNRSKYNNKPTTQKTIRTYPNGQGSSRNIVVNAKFSNVIIN